MPNNTGKTNEQIQQEIDFGLAQTGQEQTATPTPGSKDDGVKDINRFEMFYVEALISKDVGCSFYIPDYIVLGLGGYKANATGVDENTFIISAQNKYEKAEGTTAAKPRPLAANIRNEGSGQGEIYGRLIRVGKPIIVPVTNQVLKQDYKGEKRDVKKMTIRVHPLMTVNAIAFWLSNAFTTPPTEFRSKGGNRYKITGAISKDDIGITPPSVLALVNAVKALP